MLEGYISSKLGNKMFDEKEVFKIVKRHAFWGSLLMAIPDSGIGTIIFVIVLWSMYSRIAKTLDLSFADNFWKLAGVGFFVNIAVAFILDILFTFLFFLAPFIFYAQFYLSGKMYIETLKKFQ